MSARIRAALPAVALAGLLVAATALAADSTGVAPAPATRAASGARGPSPGVASLLSTVSVAAPLVLSSQISKHADSHDRSMHQALLVMTGVVAGPAVGYVYGGCARRGLVGALARGAGAAAITAMYVAASDVEGGGVVIFPAGFVALLVAGSAIWDMGTVASKVEARNRRLGLSLGPGVAPFSGAPALVLGLRR